MRHPIWWQAVVSLLLAGMAAGAQAPDPSQNVQPSGNAPTASTQSTAGAAAPSTLNPGVTITGKAPHSEPPLPKLGPDELTRCVMMHGGADHLWQLEECELDMDRERGIVLGGCFNLDGKTAPRRVVEACTESLDRSILPEPQRSFLLVGRADAYFALGYKQRALDDYDAAIKSAPLLPANERFLLYEPRADEYFALGNKLRALDDYEAAIKSAPHDAALYYNRGLVFSAQANYGAALQDLDTALELDSKFVPALRQRAKIHAAQGKLMAALADYSEAIRLQPKTAALWSDRGQVDLVQHAYGNAIDDEAQAIQLDPKLASAYYLRSVAFGDSGDRAQAVRDLRTAVDLDPSLATYVTIKGRTVVLELPPL